jgi:hypothetical protein
MRGAGVVAMPEAKSIAKAAGVCLEIAAGVYAAPRSEIELSDRIIYYETRTT